MLDEVFNHRVGAFIRQFLVVGIAADAVGVTGHGQPGAGGFLFQASRNGVELVFVGGCQLGRVELEVDIADDDDFFLDHYGFFNHWSRWRATIGIDPHAFRRARALVTAIQHTIAVFVAITVNPAIGCCRSTCLLYTSDAADE